MPVPDPTPADHPDALPSFDWEEDAEAPIDLGPCCACGKPGKFVRNIMMLDQKHPTPGNGWACLVCGLAADGAIAVLCDACLEAKAPLKFACSGLTTSHDRVPIESLSGVHEHDMSRHEADEADTAARARAAIAARIMDDFDEDDVDPEDWKIEEQMRLEMEQDERAGLNAEPDDAPPIWSPPREIWTPGDSEI